MLAAYGSDCADVGSPCGGGGGGGSTPVVEDRVCEGSTMSIDCTGIGDGTINILDASYGRQHGPDVCPHSATSDQSCHEITTTAIVAATCQGEASCSVAATNGVFGDPCGGTYKYLTVQYCCGADCEPLV